MSLSLLTTSQVNFFFKLNSLLCRFFPGDNDLPSSRKKGAIAFPMTLFSFTSYQCGFILKSLPCFKTGLALFINSGVVTANNTPNWRIYLTLTREAETALTWNQSPELPGHWSHRYNGWKIHHRYYDWGSNYQAFWIEHGQVKYKYGSHGLFHCYKMIKLKRHDYSNDSLYITFSTY